MSVTTLLRRTRNFLHDPLRFSFFLAEDAQGEPVEVESRKAEKFCVVGALRRCAHDHKLWPDYLKAYKVLESVLPEGYTTLMTLNDDKGLKAVHKLLDRGIAESTKLYGPN